MNRLLRAAAVAGVFSGVPSTAWAVASGDDPLAATWAAGRLLLPDARPGLRLLAAAGLAHGAITLGWTAVLTVALPRRRRTLAGIAAGAAIAALDLGLAHARRDDPRFAAIAALPVAPQVLDHVAFGALVGACG